MASDIEPNDPKSDYSEVLHHLYLLSRDMLLAFRLHVGKLLLDSFYNGRIHDYRDTNPHKHGSFAAFLKTCPAELADLGLGGQVARQCINARVTYDLLPPQVRDGLLFSHVVALARLDDPTARARLAMDTTQQHWTVDQLKAAIGQLTLGNYYDTDPALAGTQPSAPREEPEKAIQAGRLVTRLTKVVEELDTWNEDWKAASTGHLRSEQREKYRQALATLKAKVAAMEEQLR